MTFPYNEGAVNITARVENVRDVFVQLPGQNEFWKGLQFSCVAVVPSKTYTLNQAIHHGFAPTP
jgi:hypothetical protein